MGKERAKGKRSAKRKRKRRKKRRERGKKKIVIKIEEKKGNYESKFTWLRKSHQDEAQFVGRQELIYGNMKSMTEIEKESGEKGKELQPDIMELKTIMKGGDVALREKREKLLLWMNLSVMSLKGESF